jgi:hypothetical protein
LALGNASAVLQAVEPSSIIGAFGMNQHVLQPFDQLAGIAATTVGAIYLIIVSPRAIRIKTGTDLAVHIPHYSLVE